MTADRLDSAFSAVTDRRYSASRSFIKLDLCLTKPDRVQRRNRDRSVDSEDCDLEFVTGFHSILEHEPIGHVEALDCAGAGPAQCTRHLPIDPDFGVIINEYTQYCHCACRLESTDARWNRQIRAVPCE